MRPEVPTTSRGMEVSSTGWGPQRRGHGGFVTRLGPTSKQAKLLLEPTTSATLERPPSVPVYLGGPFSV